MKLDLDSIREVEVEKDATSLLLLKKVFPYGYLRVKQIIPDKVFYANVKTSKGKSHSHAFILNSDLGSLFEKKAEKKQQKRQVMGRPYKFCKGCVNKDICSEQFACKERDAYQTQKAEREKVSQDTRFWKNGSPKKNLMLCTYAKYRYAHKKTAGLCQKEKCAFYGEAGCFLGIDNGR